MDYIDIIQQKTKKAVTVGIVGPVVIQLLETEFPRRVSQVIFHKQMKALCKLAGIKGLVPRFKNNSKTRRKEIIKDPKYTFVTHLLCDVLLHLISMVETPLLLNITGHSKEHRFLPYIGKHQNKDALAEVFMQPARVIW